MGNPELKSQETKESKVWIDIIPSKETKESEKWQEIQKETQIKLEELKREIQKDWMSINLAKQILENINEISPENKPFIIWGIFSWLNQKWISILWVNSNGKIILREWKQSSVKKDTTISSKEETLRYSSLLNSANLSVSDINKALLYRTNSVDQYIDEKLDGKLSTSEYVQKLMEKYEFKFDWILVKDMSIWSEADLKILKQKISEKVTDNQADKEFLLTYFDDKFYRKGKSNSENDINDYKNVSNTNQKKLLDELSNLTPEQKFAVWITDSNKASQIAREWTKDPIWTFQKNINVENFLLAIIFWAIWAIFGWKTWFWIWAILWFWIWAWWLSFASEALNKWLKDKNSPKKPTQDIESKSDIYWKINFSWETDNAKKLKLESIWWELSKNNEFLKAPTSILSIFETQKDEAKIKDSLKSYWIELTSDNKEYYKTIFEEILKQRKAAWIWEPLENETIEQYLERGSRKTTEAAVATWVAAVITNEKANDLLNSPYANTFTYKIVDGKTYLIWENWEYLIQNNELNKEAKEILKKYEKLGILNEILQIWIPEAEKQASTLLLKWIRSWTTIIPEAIKKINATFEQLFLKVQKGENIDNDINTIWSEIEKAESAKSIIGSSDMEKVKRIFNSQETKDQKLLQIYNTMRYSWWSGNSEWVKNQVAEHLLKQKWFKNIDDILKNPETFNLIKNNNKQKLKELVWEEIATEILSAYSKIKIKQEKQREEYSKVVTRINEVRKTNKEEEINLNDYIELNTEISVMELLKYSLITKQIFEMTSRWDEKSSYTWLYANMVWLAQNKWNDWVIISDDNIDNAIDLSSTIALAAVSMWVWAIAARWAIAAASWWARITTLSSRLANLWTKWKVAGFAWTSIIEWTAFYQGYNTMNNIIYGNNTFENAGNLKEISKTIAFMWVLRWVSWIWNKIWDSQMNIILARTLNQKDTITLTEKALAFIWKMTDKVPAWILKNTGEILLKWWLITTTSVWLDYVFEWESDWTWEEYIQAVMLVGVIKWAWKIKFERRNWTVTASETTPQQTTNILQKVKEKVSSVNIPEWAKKHILDIVKTWILSWTVWTTLEWWLNIFTWWYNEKTALEITWDLISTFTKYAIIWWSLKGIYLWTKWATKMLNLWWSTPWVLSTLSSNKILLWTTIIWWTLYEVYSN